MENKSTPLIIAATCILLVGGVAAAVYTLQNDSPASVPQESTVAPADRLMAEDYIREHIDELTNEQATLGGTFSVSRLDWQDNGVVLITYDDGHVEHQATANVEVGDSSVTVTNFQSLNEELETYTNTTYAYSIEFPAWWDIRTYSPEASTIGTERNEAMSGQVDVEVFTLSEADTNAQEAIERHLLNSCAADGPTGSIECTAVASRDTFNTMAGVQGQMFTLTERVTNTESSQTVTRTRGPYFMIALQGGSFLIVRPAANLETSAIDTPMVNQVAESMKMVTVSSTSSGISSASNSSTRPLAQEGEFCGGIAGFQCAGGLTCKMEGDFPDAGGTCVKQ